jgi:dihydroorotate dehydrogenase (NAD+) catalytic subunit
LSGPALFGTTFQNAVLLASGTAGFGHEVDGVIDLESLGGIVTKAVTPEPRPGHPAPRVAEFRGGMLNSVGLANPGLHAVRERHLPRIAAMLRRARILVNVAGNVVDDYVCVLQGLSDYPAITAFEINASCPNTAQGGLEFGQSTAALADLVKRCRQATRRPLVVKLSPVLPDIAGMAAVAHGQGADGVTLVNTMPGTLPGRLGHASGGVSGPALLPVGVLATRRVREQIDIPIIGVGGIRSAHDARLYLDAGASLVAIGTAALADPRVPARIARALEHG